MRVLSRLFRGKFLAGVIRLRAQGKLTLAGQLSRLQSDAAFRGWCRKLSRSEWVVYAKRPFGGPEQVLKYLARYTHRVAISNQRLLRVEHGRVTFRYKDYARGGRSRTMTLSAVEFLRRFVDHVLPKGFMRIRYYGLLSNPQRAQQLARCRELLTAHPPSTDGIECPAHDGRDDASATEKQRLCPHCGAGVLVCVESSPRPVVRSRESPLGLGQFLMARSGISEVHCARLAVRGDRGPRRGVRVGDAPSCQTPPDAVKVMRQRRPRPSGSNCPGDYAVVD